MVLPLIISPGDPGHISHHEQLHALVPRTALLDTVQGFTAAQSFADDVSFGSGRPWTDVRHPDFGATGDGVTDDTVAVQDAIDAAPVGSTVFFPAGTYKVSSLDLDKNVTLLGVGWRVQVSQAFGHASYTDPLNFDGSVLLVTDTTGYGLDVNATASRRVWLRHLAIIGPGSGTSTGLRCGNASSMHGGLENVGIYNFATLLEAPFLISAAIYDLHLRGCQTGIYAPAGGSCNANTWINTDIGFSSSYAIRIDAGLVNTFQGGTLQNISGTAGAYTVGDSTHFSGWYSEAVTATNSFVLAGTGGSLTNSRWTPGDGGVTVSGNRNRLDGLRGGSTALTVTGSDNVGDAITGFATPSDSGLRNTIEPQNSAGGRRTMHGGLIHRVVAFANGDTTPSVLGANIFTCANTGATSITDFDDGIDGQEIKVKLDNNTTLVHASALMRLAGAANITGTTSDMVTLVSIGGIWYEVARSVN